MLNKKLLSLVLCYKHIQMSCISTDKSGGAYYKQSFPIGSSTRYLSAEHVGKYITCICNSVYGHQQNFVMLSTRSNKVKLSLCVP